ncbi:MAG: DUF969 domain-containing protein [Anaerococcus sp.]|jgi:uncharacterized membrane protein|nr:DUF969 domain-containing protein [Peptoniphilaceae bacterium]MDY3055375.1 DUF969 domain-containing protein [Anaerococcus sp.]
MEYLKLIGILIIVLGFMFKANTMFIVVLAGFVTALVSGMSIMDFLTILGDSFVENRIVTLFIITLPVIGLSEKNGLKQRAVDLINSRKNLTTGKFLSIYLFIKEIAGFFSIKLGGHAEMVRPIIEPMAQASFEANEGEVKEEVKDKIKARSAAMENFGNFFAQNTFMGAGGVLLIAGTLDSLGYPASNIDIAKFSLPVAIIVFILVVIKNVMDDKKLKKINGGK